MVTSLQSKKAEWFYLNSTIWLQEDYYETTSHIFNFYILPQWESAHISTSTALENAHY